MTAEYLIEENLVSNAILIAMVQQCTKADNGFITENKYLLIGITKGSFFP